MDFVRGSYLNIGTGAITPVSNEFTITAWVQPRGVPAGGSPYTILSTADPSPYSGLGMYLDNTTGAIGSRRNNAAGFEYSAKVAPVGVWSFVAIKGIATVAGNISASLNGDAWTQFITGDTTTVVPDGAVPHVIGSDSVFDITYGFDGAIADVRYYDYQMTDDEILTMYTLLGRDNFRNLLLGQWCIVQEPPGPIDLGSVVATAQIGAWATTTTRAVEAGTNRALVCMISYEYPTVGNNLSALGWGDQQLTFLTRVNTTIAGDKQFIEVWYALESVITTVTGTAFAPTYTVATPTDVKYSHVFYENIKQAVPLAFASAFSDVGASPLDTAAINTAVGGVNVGVVCANRRQGATTANNGYAVGTNESSGSTRMTSSYILTNGSSTVVSFSNNNPTSWCSIGVSFAPPDAVPGSFTQLYDGGPDEKNIVAADMSGTITVVETPLRI